MLGKRSRPTFARTSSMSRFTVDVATTDAPPPPPIAGEFYHMLSPRHVRRTFSGGLSEETADFLRSCGLCNRSLAPGRDIYMYRGDTAFCSLECREQQMNQDESKERRAAAKGGEIHHPEQAAAAAEAETVAAA
ncbi:FCS-Like Zinc finger 7-like [Salvia hispanica]|uniref:FCS-Like Zinc finger 7-like n=1 Tax=Salvia hispanica TaxID=49212 RepID=UPI0020090862|nr:FCS-Like Zinc finger 7-like [Salvia hispanica]